MGRWRACLRPTLLAQVGFVAGGLGALFGLAGLAYLAHPWWIIRRRRLRRLSAASTPKLVTYLDELRREMALSRAPTWWLAPHSRTTGGQAFGLPGRRCVQLDAGLVLRYATDRPAFRAVVLHELAHLKNRDVDKTYLTIGVWRAFLLVGVVPYLLLILHPQLLWHPWDWHPRTTMFVAEPRRAAYVLGSLLLLTGLVYLTRNAVLRVRETHADAVAAACDGPAGALPAVLERLPATGSGRMTRWTWWTRWGTHPSPRQRLDTVRDPRLLLTAGLWELCGAGIAAGMFAANLKLLIGVYIGLDPVLGLALIGLAIGPPMAAMLAIAIWRAAAAIPGGRPSARTWLAGPVVLVGGFLGGSFLSLSTVHQLAGVTPSVGPASWLVSELLLTIGAVLLAAWITSVAGGILAAMSPRVWAMPAVVASAALVGATALTVWLPFSQVNFGFALRWGEQPVVGADIGWYAWLAALSGGGVEMAFRLVYHPLTLPSLTVLWLVPVLAGLRRPTAAPADPPPDRVPVRRAVIPALIGGAAVAVVGAALPLVAKATLPVEARRDPDPDAVEAPFYLILAGATVLVASLAVAVVMAVVVARGGRHRPTLAVLAGSLTVLLSTVVAFYVAGPTQCLTNVWDLQPPLTRCFPIQKVSTLSDTTHWAAVQGIIIAIPLVLVAGALGALYRRWRSTTTPPTPAAPGRWPGFVLTVATVVLLVGAVGTLTWAILPTAYDVWLSLVFG